MVYQNKKTKELVVAIRFYHYSDYSLEEIKKLFNSYPYTIEYFPRSDGYVDQRIVFNNNMVKYIVENGDWIILKDKDICEAYEALDHWDFKQQYKWVDDLKKANEFSQRLLGGV